MRSPSRAPLKARAALVLAAAIMGLSLSAIPANAACAYPKIELTSFALGAQQPRFYWAAEEGTFAFVSAQALEWCNNVDSGSAKWKIVPGTGTIADTDPDDGIFTFAGDPSDPHQPGFANELVEALSDGVDSQPVEDVTVVLESNGGGDIVAPSTAPIYLVDSDSTLQVSTAPSSTSPAISENQDFKFPIFKAGPGSANDVTVTVSGGTPGSDYAQPAAVDFSSTEDFKIVTIDILPDNTDTGTETYTATITDGGGAGIGTTDSMQFTVSDIQSDDDPPLTSFHHPKNGVTYKFGSAKARTIHVYAPGPSVEPSGIVDSSVKTALKRTMKSGGCKWWNGSGWVNDGCADSNRNQHWLKTEFLYIFNGKRLYEHFLKQNLPPSVGTPTKFFHVYSTAQDGAGNVDDQIDLGRNKNKFEIKKF